MRTLACAALAVFLGGCVVIPARGAVGSGASGGSSHPHGGPPGQTGTAPGHQKHGKKKHAKHDKKCGHAHKKHKGKHVYEVDGVWVTEDGVVVVF